MLEERHRILNMMAEGKINVTEAEALLDALGAQKGAREPASKAQAVDPLPVPKYLRVLVEGQTEGQPNKVNVRVPLELIRAGMRLAALVPSVAYGPVNRALKENGVDIDISKLKTDELEGLVAHLQELEVDVDDGSEKVRVFCE